jgi:hypothetical protein
MSDDESQYLGGKGGELPEVEVVDPSTLPERTPTRGVAGIGRKVRAQKRYDTAMVALMAGRYVPQAIKTIAELMRSADRDSVRLRASTTMVELACGLETSDQGPEATKVYVLATAPEQRSSGAVVSTQELAEELRRRLGK